MPRPGTPPSCSLPKLRGRLVTSLALLIGLATSGYTSGQDDEEEDPFEALMEQEAEAARDDYDKLRHSLYVEAEEMDGVSTSGEREGRWQVNPSTPTYTSRRCCVCKELKPIRQKIRVQKGGTYAVWVRYRLRAEKRAPFVVKVVKAGKPVFEHRYYAQNGQSGPVKALQKERDLWFDIAGMQEGMFSGTEWAWELAKAELPEGEAELVIEPQKPSHDFELTLDAVFITQSFGFRPTFSDFHQVWVRYRLIEVEPSTAEYTVDVAVQWLRLVIIGSRRTIHTGAGTMTGADGKGIRVGKNSTWLELYDELKYGAAYCTTVFRPTRGSPEISKVVAELDLAWGPRDGQVIKTLREVADLGSVFGVKMPTERSRERDAIVTSVWATRFTDTFRTFTDLSRERHERIKRLVPEPVGCSKYYNFCTGVSPPGGGYASSEIMKLELEAVSRMGVNALYASGQKWPRRLGLGHLFPDRYYTAGASPARYWTRRACPNHPDNPTRADETMKRGADSFRERTEDPEAGNRVFGMKIGDEIGCAVPQAHIDTCEDCQHQFHEFLRGEKFDPARFGRTWAEVRWTPREAAVDEFQRLVHYYSVLFLSANTAYLHAKLVKGGQDHYGSNIPIGYNVNPTPIMGGMHLDWFEMERHKGISAQWMEVIGSIQPGGASFLADLTWGIVSRRNIGMGIYCLYVGQKTPRDVLAFAARGCKSFILYNYGPRTLGAADAFSESDYAIQSAAAATRPIVAAEEFLHDAKRPPRQAAMIYSRTAEIWGDDNAITRDRAFTYLALNHSQIPMDILSEWDALDGRLSRYRVCYLNGTHLRRDVAEKVRDWVQAGGRLWADVGAGMRDEADRRMDVLEEVFGARQKSVERKYPVSFGYHRALTPDAELETVKWQPGPWGDGGETVCELQRALIEPTSGKVVATFSDGPPAAVTHSYGKGKATLLAYAAGMTYSRFYRQPKREEPYRFDALDRAVIVQAALDAGVERPVVASVPGIEVNRLDSERGTAITLIDMFLQKPTAKIEIPMKAKPRKVSSVKSGELEFRYEDGRLSFELTFEPLDIVMIEL